MSLKGIAKATVAILERGDYIAPSGTTRSIASELSLAIAHTTLYRPDDFPLRDERQRSGGLPLCGVREGTTQAIARALVEQDRLDDLVLLGFASARNVCGGFMKGARSQEEDLARSSGLYACLRTQPDYYTINREQDSLLYTDHLIYSPRVPFFREKNRALLETPFTASIITAPAPNAGQFLRQGLGTPEQVVEALRRRARHVLEIARHHGHRHLLLGAWGCGVFCNDPEHVAEVFDTWLRAPEFEGSFDRIIFGIHDLSPRQDVLRAFHERFTSKEARQRGSM